MSSISTSSRSTLLNADVKSSLFCSCTVLQYVKQLKVGLFTFIQMCKTWCYVNNTMHYCTVSDSIRIILVCWKRATCYDNARTIIYCTDWEHIIKSGWDCPCADRLTVPFKARRLKIGAMQGHINSRAKRVSTLAKKAVGTSNVGMKWQDWDYIPEFKFILVP